MNPLLTVIIAIAALGVATWLIFKMIDKFSDNPIEDDEINSDFTFENIEKLFSDREEFKHYHQHIKDARSEESAIIQKKALEMKERASQQMKDLELTLKNANR